MNPVIIRPAAAAEIDEAYLWYESQRTGLGEEFLAEVNGTLERIREMPELFAVLRRDTRRAMLIRFPYSLTGRLPLSAGWRRCDPRCLLPRETKPEGVARPDVMANIEFERTAQSLR